MSSQPIRERITSTPSTVRACWARLEPIRNRVRTRFEVDTRALAAVRMALALIILVDLVHRAPYIRLFLSDDGAYPVAAYEVTYSQYTGYSLHAFSGEVWFVQFMFVVAGLFAVLLLAGYKTRFVGLASLLLLFSLHARNPAVLNGGDRLFKLLLAIALLTPLGERWSIDALRRGEARRTVASFGTAALLVQPIVVFTSNAILKHRGENWYAGDALEIALLNDSMRWYLGNVIVEYSALMTILNYAWITLLAGSGLFLLASTGRVRSAATFAYLGAFVGMLTSMAVGWFPLILVTAVLPFLTAVVWDMVAGLVPSGWRNRLPERDDLGPLGRPPLERRLLEGVRQRGYPTLAGIPKTVLSILGLLVLVWMLTFAAADVTTYDVPETVDHQHLDQQSWGLYAPDPSEGYTWYVVEAELDDGRSVDAISGGPVDFERPADGTEAYETFRHRKFMRLVWNSGEGDTSSLVAKGYAEWACDQARDSYGDRVEAVTVHRFYQPSPLDGEYEEPTQETVIGHDCAA